MRKTRTTISRKARTESRSDTWPTYSEPVRDER
jgi:hypothetical protein